MESAFLLILGEGRGLQYVSYNNIYCVDMFFAFDSGAGYKNHPLTLEGGYIYIHIFYFSLTCNRVSFPLLFLIILDQALV